MVRRLLALLFLGVTLGSGYLAYVQYFKWRGCFNELGRCLDAEAGVVHQAQSGIGWLALTALAFGAFVVMAWPMVKPKR